MCENIKELAGIHNRRLGPVVLCVLCVVCCVAKKSAIHSIMIQYNCTLYNIIIRRLDHHDDNIICLDSSTHDTHDQGCPKV
jgi:hypothetical protein